MRDGRISLGSLFGQRSSQDQRMFTISVIRKYYQRKHEDNILLNKLHQPSDLGKTPSKTITSLLVLLSEALQCVSHSTALQKLLQIVSTFKQTEQKNQSKTKIFQRDISITTQRKKLKKGYRAREIRRYHSDSKSEVSFCFLPVQLLVLILIMIFPSKGSAASTFPLNPVTSNIMNLHKTLLITLPCWLQHPRNQQQQKQQPGVRKARIIKNHNFHLSLSTAITTRSDEDATIPSPLGFKRSKSITFTPLAWNRTMTAFAFPALFLPQPIVSPFLNKGIGTNTVGNFLKGRLQPHNSFPTSLFLANPLSASWEEERNTTVLMTTSSDTSCGSTTGNASSETLTTALDGNSPPSPSFVEDSIPCSDKNNDMKGNGSKMSHNANKMIESVHLKLASMAMLPKPNTQDFTQERLEEEEGILAVGKECDNIRTNGELSAFNNDSILKTKSDRNDDNKYNNAEDPSDDIKSKNEETAATAVSRQKMVTLLTYQHPGRNETLNGLGIPVEKFKSWIRYCLFHADEEFSSLPNYSSSQPHHYQQTNQEAYNFLPDIEECITSTQIPVNDSNTRMKLREEWFARRLISERTEILASYPSDDKNVNNDDNDIVRKENRKKVSIEENDNEIVSNKRGGFDDLLNVYADRLVGILQDELTEQQQQHLNLHAEIEVNEDKSTYQTKSTSVLCAWLENEFGEAETKQLHFSNFSQLSEGEQLKLMQNFLDWFRDNFPYYYDKCGSCGASYREDARNSLASNENDNMCANDIGTDNKEEEEEEEEEDGSTFLGYVYPTKAELSGKASRTELYQCHKCQHYTRFPRYNTVSSIVQCKKGRCGEYAILLFRILRELGHRARWVVDWSDHVWAECMIGTDETRSEAPITVEEENITTNGRWVHLDPCEAAVDKPLLYQEWGKRQTFIMAFWAPPTSSMTFEGKVNQSFNQCSNDENVGIGGIGKAAMLNYNSSTLTRENGNGVNVDVSKDKSVSTKDKPPTDDTNSIQRDLIKNSVDRNMIGSDALFPFVEDVTSQYTTDSLEVIQSRREESNNQIKVSLVEVEDKLRRTLFHLHRREQ